MVCGWLEFRRCAAVVLLVPCVMFGIDRCIDVVLSTACLYFMFLVVMSTY